MATIDRCRAASGPESRGAAGPTVASRPLVDVRIEAVTTRAGARPHLHDVSLHVRYGEFLGILGPPHAGKTALLRAVAGFQPVAGGRILVDGQDIGGLPPGRRGIGLVPHEGALWPHLSVRQHVAFALEQGDLGAADVARRTEVVLGRLRIAELADARPGALSTEQRRRLALARALAAEPRVLLLDEPLAHLDPVARKTLRLELARLHADLAVTTLCATRDAADALALSNRLAVVGDGRVLQVGEPEEVYRHPASRAVAEALGPANFLRVHVVEVRDLGVVVETERGDRVPVAGIGAFREGSQGLLVMRPEAILLTDAAMARGPGIPGRIALRVFEGGRQVYEVDIGVGTPVRVEVPTASDTRTFRLGERVRVEISSDTAVLVAADRAG
jgi:ABC-type Fe3+/spermidine/putrescine transport system ATPase subunit